LQALELATQPQEDRMNILWLFDTCGYIVGPAIILAGLWAVALCLWASRPSSTRQERRRALVAAASPVAVSLAGVVFGLVVWWTGDEPGIPWAALGKVCLAGATVAAVPLVWSILLLRGKVACPPPEDQSS
jgi:hypothetical protein